MLLCHNLLCVSVFLLLCVTVAITYLIVSISLYLLVSRHYHKAAISAYMSLVCLAHCVIELFT